MKTQPTPASGQTIKTATTKTMWAIKYVEKHSVRIIEVTLGAYLSDKTTVWAMPVDRSGNFADIETYPAHSNDLFPAREAAVTELIARLEKEKLSLSEEISKWTSQSPIANQRGNPEAAELSKINTLFKEGFSRLNKKG